MKTSLFIFLVLYVLTLTAHQPLSSNKSVDTVFNKAFPDATNIKWYENEGNFVVYFTIVPIHYQLNFNHAADIKQSTRYYEAKYLPPFILTRLAQKFPGPEIENVTEVQDATTTNYMIRLNDKEKIIELKSDASGNFEVHKILKKEK